MATYIEDLLPNTTGQNLGSPSQRWDGFFNSIDVLGSTLGGGSGGGPDSISVISTSINLAFQGSANLFVLATGGMGIAPILPDATSNAGKQVTVKRVDASVGQVLVTPLGLDTIDTSANYALTNQFQYVVLKAASGGWWISGGN